MVSFGNLWLVGLINLLVPCHCPFCLDSERRWLFSQHLEPSTLLTFRVLSGRAFREFWGSVFEESHSHWHQGWYSWNVVFNSERVKWRIRVACIWYSRLSKRTRIAKRAMIGNSCSQNSQTQQPGWKRQNLRQHHLQETQIFSWSARSQICMEELKESFSESKMLCVLTRCRCAQPRVYMHA